MYPTSDQSIDTAYGAKGDWWSTGWHDGVDFAVSTGTDCRAMWSGTVVEAAYPTSFGSAFGRAVVIDHDKLPDGSPGLWALYAHLSAESVSVGQRVDAGQLIGETGATGNVSGPHLHVGVYPQPRWSAGGGVDPQPWLDADTAPAGPTNPNGVTPGDIAIVTANGSLNGRADPDPTAPVVTSRPYAAELAVDAVEDGWAHDGDDDAWFSTDYLWPKLDDPGNPNQVGTGQTVEVTANGGLTARTLPGGPPRYTDAGDILVRPTGYQLAVMDVADGWASGGTNWYSTDYLRPVTVDTGPPAWSSKPTLILDDPTPDPDRNVSYMQAVVRVGPVDADAGAWDETYLVAQDVNNDGNLRFARFYPDGSFTGELMTVNDAGHGQTFHAYRSAAGNLYVWCGENPAYRYAWAPGKTVSRSSGTKMDYQGCRPVGSHEPWVGFRDATDTRETFHLFDRTDFTDGTNRSKPVKSVTVDKRTSYTQQSWALTADRIYRIMGSTNDNPPHGTRLHILDVFDWSGRLLLDRFDITAMAIESSSDEPEGLTFTGTPGQLLAGKREGSTDPGKRSYPLWTITGLP